MGFKVAGSALTKEQAVEEVWKLIMPQPFSTVNVDAEGEPDRQELPDIRDKLEARLAPMKVCFGLGLGSELANGTLRLWVESKSAADRGIGLDAAHVSLPSDPLPIRVGTRGEYRIGRSNVLLDTVIYEFENGGSPEYIAHAYDTLRLADVYAVLAWYMNHKDEVLAYLKAREERGAELRRKIEASQPNRTDLLAEALARRSRMEQGHAASGK